MSCTTDTPRRQASAKDTKGATPRSAETLDDIRAALGMPHSRIAWHLGVDPNTVRRWFRGELSPSPSSIQALRMLVVVRQAAPGVLGLLRSAPVHEFLAAVRTLSPHLMAGEADRTFAGHITDGADL